MTQCRIYRILEGQKPSWFSDGRHAYINRALGSPLWGLLYGAVRTRTRKGTRSSTWSVNAQDCRGGDLNVWVLRFSMICIVCGLCLYSVLRTFWFKDFLAGVLFVFGGRMSPECFLHWLRFH